MKAGPVDEYVIIFTPIEYLNLDYQHIVSMLLLAGGLAQALLILYSKSRY